MPRYGDDANERIARRARPPVGSPTTPPSSPPPVSTAPTAGQQIVIPAGATSVDQVPGLATFHGIPLDLIKAVYGDLSSITNPQRAAEYLQPFVQPWQEKNYQAIFQQLTQGMRADPSILDHMAPILERMGVHVMRNAAGVAGKVTLPNGQIVDVGRSFNSGDPSQMQWQWMTGGGPNPSRGGLNVGEAPPNFGQAPAPWSEQFQAPAVPGPLQQPFQAPTLQQLQASPGYQERFRMGQQALERSAASRGTILNAGTLKAEQRYGQDYASNEYNNLFNQDLSGRQQQFGEYQTNYGNAWQNYEGRYNQYLNAFNIKRSIDTDYWGRLNDVSTQGLSAAQGTRSPVPPLT